MSSDYKCPLVEAIIDETMCYDIQMVTGPGNLINKSILDYYIPYFDITKVTDERAIVFCTNCPFNQLSGPSTQTGQKDKEAVTA